jgi:hypothetical protein
MGNAAAANRPLAELLRCMPGLIAADERLNPFGSPAQRGRFLKGLRKAGVARKMIATRRLSPDVRRSALKGWVTRAG